uniref:Cysteine sulfinic acid decarboxylase n=1 Tax=Macrostomum lignano TaxID=282301 RepID=A0A1I8FA17_9PLAT
DAASEQGYEGTVSFITEVVDLLLEYLHRINDPATRCWTFTTLTSCGEALSHCLEIPVEPRDLEQILSDCKETLKYAVKTGTRASSTSSRRALTSSPWLREWLTAATNTNMLFTYEIAPVFVLMEEVTLQKMREHIGWESGDGILAPGGSISNLYAAMVARYNRFPEVKMRGMRAVPELAMFTSKDAHYSVKKSAAILGMGMDSVYLVDTDNRCCPSTGAADRTRPQPRSGALLRQRHRRHTTVLGAFDPLDAIADVVRAGTGSGSTWTRPGAAACCSASDTATCWPGCSVPTRARDLLPERHIGLLQGCNGMQADYLFQQDKQYDVSYDTGDKSIQCGRRNDIFQSLAVLEGQGLREQVDYLIDLANYLCQQLRSVARLRDGDGETRLCQRVCFLVRAEKFRSMKPGTGEATAPSTSEGADDGERTTMVGYQPLGNLPNFFRMIVSNPAATEADIDFLLDCIEKYSAEIFDDQPDEAGIGGGGGPAQ